MKSRFSIFLVFLVFFFIPALAYADSVYLRDGQRVDGTIVNQSRAEVQIRTTAGVRSIQKTDILRITFGISPEERQEELNRIQEQQRKVEEENRQKKIEEENRAAEEKRKQESSIEQAENAKREESLRRKYLDFSFGVGRGNESTQMQEQWSQYRYIFVSRAGLDPLSGAVSRLNDQNLDFRAWQIAFRYTVNRWFGGVSYRESRSMPHSPIFVYNRNDSTTSDYTATLLNTEFHPLKKEDYSAFIGYTFFRRSSLDLSAIVSGRGLNQLATIRQTGIGFFNFISSSSIGPTLPGGVNSYLDMHLRGFNPGLETVWRPNSSSELTFDFLYSILHGAWRMQDLFSASVDSSTYTLNYTQLSARTLQKSFFFSTKYRYELKNGWALAVTGYIESGRTRLTDARILGTAGLRASGGSFNTDQLGLVQFFAINFSLNNHIFTTRLKRKEEVRGISIGIEKRINFLN